MNPVTYAKTRNREENRISARQRHLISCRNGWVKLAAMITTIGAKGGLRQTVRLLEIYTKLLDAFGPQGWWPANSDFEMCVGAILTQSTAWVNVEKAIANMRCGGLLDPAVIGKMPDEALAEVIRPSGYYNAKAQKLKTFCKHLHQRHGGSLVSLFHVKLPDLREELLSIWGIGPETADSIILYGARRPVFVVDSYTRRIFGRLGLTPPQVDYALLQRFFMENLSPDVPLFQEYHALIVALGKDICRPSPICSRCPLGDLCPSKSE